MTAGSNIAFKIATKPTKPLQIETWLLLTAYKLSSSYPMIISLSAKSGRNLTIIFAVRQAFIRLKSTT